MLLSTRRHSGGDVIVVVVVASRLSMLYDNARRDIDGVTTSILSRRNPPPISPSLSGSVFIGGDSINKPAALL